MYEQPWENRGTDNGENNLTREAEVTSGFVFRG